MSDTPRTNNFAAQGREWIPLGVFECLERELNEANADRLRLRSILQSIDLSPCDGGSCMIATNADDCIQMALTTPPPPVVAKADADALADACKLCAAVIGPPDNIEWAPIKDCDAAYAAAQTAMQAYRTKYPTQFQP